MADLPGDPGLPPGCSQRQIDRAFGGEIPSADERREMLWDALASIALSPYEVVCLTMSDDGSEPEIERRRR